MPGFLWTLSLELFIFADSALCPFVIINHSYEHDYMLTSASPSSKSPGLGMVLGTPDNEVNVTDCRALLQNSLGLLHSIRYVPRITYLIFPRSDFFFFFSKVCMTCDFG